MICPDARTGGGRLPADKGSTADILAQGRADGLPGQKRKQPGEGAAYPRIRAVLLTYWPPGGRFAGADARTARRGGRLPADNVSTADIFTWAGRTVCRERGANSPARGPLTRAVSLTYWPGRADGLAEQRREQPGEGAAYPRIRSTSLTYWRVSSQPVPPGGTPGSALGSARSALKRSTGPFPRRASPPK